MNRTTVAVAAVLFAGALGLELAPTSGPSEGALASVARADRNMSYCVQERAAEWGGEECGDDSVRVELQNICREAVRVHWCVTEASGSKHCAVTPSLEPRETTTASACNAARPAEVEVAACRPGESCRVD